MIVYKLADDMQRRYHSTMMLLSHEYKLTGRCCGLGLGFDGGQFLQHFCFFFFVHRSTLPFLHFLTRLSTVHFHSLLFFFLVEFCCMSMKADEM